MSMNIEMSGIFKQEIVTRIAFFHLLTGLVAGIEYKYLGCFKDSSTNPDLSGQQTLIPNITVQSCIALCRTAGFPYSGVQQLNKCSCGDTYNQYRPSTNCSGCQSGSRCGGYLANDVFYNSACNTSLSVLVSYDVISDYVTARRTCVKSNGDVTPPFSNSVIQSILTLWADTNISSVWVGFRRRVPTSDYEWTDENMQPAYKNSSYTGYWTTGDPQIEDCVSLILSTGKWKSAPCSTKLPFVCSESNTDDTTADTPADQSSFDKHKMIVFFVVMTLFFSCYSFSCLIYSVHQFIKHCIDKPAKIRAKLARKRSKKLIKESGHTNSLTTSSLDAENKIDLSCIKNSDSFQINSHLIPGVKAATLPDLFSHLNPAFSLTTPEGGDTNKPLPLSNDEKLRARLLENASRESRGRKPEENIPVTGPIISQEGHVMERNDYAELNEMLNEGKSRVPPIMSVNEILKQKVLSKNRP